ncbi:MAG: hypothetical protein FWG08_02730 [Propionibacteriaceae bacterium]|nr:hypothetical protein [Propionibacteriaceae bacterium]
MKFPDKYSQWMEKATALWDSMPATVHTILIISVVVLLGLFVLGVIKDFLKTWIKIILVVAIVAAVCIAFPWVGASLLALLDWLWSAITG